MFLVLLLPSSAEHFCTRNQILCHGHGVSFRVKEGRFPTSKVTFCAMTTVFPTSTSPSHPFLFRVTPRPPCSHPPHLSPTTAHTPHTSSPTQNSRHFRPCKRAFAQTLCGPLDPNKVTVMGIPIKRDASSRDDSEASLRVNLKRKASLSGGFKFKNSYRDIQVTRRCSDLDQVRIHGEVQRPGTWCKSENPPHWFMHTLAAHRQELEARAPGAFTGKLSDHTGYMLTFKVDTPRGSCPGWTKT